MARHDGPTGPAGYAGSACVRPLPEGRLAITSRGRAVGGESFVAWGDGACVEGRTRKGCGAAVEVGPRRSPTFAICCCGRFWRGWTPLRPVPFAVVGRGLVPRRPSPFLRSENGHAPGRRIRGCVAPNDDGDGPSGGPQAASPTNCLCTFSPSRLIIFAEGGILYPRDRSEGKASSLRQGGGVRPFLSEVAQVHVQTNPVRRCFVCVRASRSSSC